MFIGEWSPSWTNANITGIPNILKLKEENPEAPEAKFRYLCFQINNKYN